MKKLIYITITAMFIAAWFSGAAMAGSDQYIGDTAIYSGSTSTLRPNVLILFDNSAIMTSAASSGDPYWPYDTFAEPFEGSNVAVGDTDGWFNNTYWTNTAISGSVKWARSTSYEQGGSYSLFSAGNISSSDMALATRSFGVISVTSSTTLSFYHTYKFHTSGGSCNDGGTLEYSADGGTTWTVVPDSAFTAGGFNSGSYTGGVVSGTGNPIADKKAWCGGSLGAMTQVTVNLGGISGLAGNVAKIRWHSGYDNTSSGSKPSNGWYIDSILISNIAYSGSRDPWTVYKLTACTGGVCNYVSHIADTSWDLNSPTNITCTSSLTRPSLAAPVPSAPVSGNAKGSLQYSGTYSGAGAASLKNNGTCGNGGADATYLGNLLNYNAAASSGTSEAAVRIVRDAVASVVGSTRETVNFGLMVFGNKGGKIVKPVANISDSTSYNNFIAALPGTGSTGSGGSYAEGPSPAEALLGSNIRPIAEALHDAGAYFKSINSNRDNVYSNRICAAAAVSGSLTSPIQYSCQKNYVIVVSRGAATADNDPKLCTGAVLGGTIGNYDGDSPDPGDNCSGGNHLMDDVALAIYAKDSAGNDASAFDMSTPLTGIQRVITTVIQVFESSTLSQRAADSSHGRGAYYLANNANELSTALTNAMANIVLEADTSFVAPVVPVSPENRTYSGSRVYLGFFKPISQKPWFGNLKKYGIDSSNNIVDANGNIATNSDGSFKSTAVSYWSTSADAGLVESGGAGELLWSRDFTTDPRSIYTYVSSTTTTLTNSSNAFTAANTGLSSTLIDFVKGIDSYDDDGDGNTTEKRDWLLGDILHSKPLVVNYKAYDYSYEGNCLDPNANKTMIYVGNNDGMLHAFRDCDGKEMWAFIPQDLLAKLSDLRGLSHSYFVDSSASLYKYDANSDGTIDSTVGDKAIIVFGERRGGGSDTGPTKGYYYALDVSDPATPVYLWRLSNTESPSGTNTDYSELGETWSEPKIVKMKISVSGSDVDKIVSIIGAGYDNIHEDTRYGATQTFSDASSVTITDTGSGSVTSSGTTGAGSLTNPKGRGIYIVEIAQLSSTGVPAFTNSGRKIWGYTYADNSAMTFSILSEVSALDTDYNGYVDRLYVGDTGGNIWRFNVTSSSTASWTARKIFSSNPGSDSTNGRKIFFKPSVSFESGYQMLFFGTGDREHPLNWAVTDRMYGIKDKDSDQTTTIVEDNTDDIHTLVDVTDDYLQACTTDCTQVNSILSSLDTLFGWYIKLVDVTTNVTVGEKVLAPALVFNKVAYYTTYAPSTTVPTDPCQPGNLGTSSLYAVDYKTGEAAINYDTTNDSTSTTNTRATQTAGQVLIRSDRKLALGSGIPSGIVIIVGASGEDKLLIGCGGALCSAAASGGGTIIPLYWRQK